MNKGFFIITGTSRGIGEALAQILLQEGHHVVGISRNESSMLSEYSNFTHHKFDLLDISGIDALLTKIINVSNVTDYEMIGLINNAAVLEPLKSIEDCTSEEISINLQIDLTSPAVLTSNFIRLVQNLSMRKKIMNISSGSAIYASPDMSVYSAAKAGMNMFTRCVGEEQKMNSDPIEVIAVGPGMVETQMQEIARSKKPKDFQMAKFFRDAHSQGELTSTVAAAQKLNSILFEKYETGSIL